jgi:hypothetical protein
VTRAPRRSSGRAEAVRPAYQRGPDTALLVCAECGANYLNDQPGRAAHKAVFGHQPKAPGPVNCGHDKEER